MGRPEIDSIPDISRLASLFADPGRARMLSLLMPGRALTASELARGAALTPQAASNHLARLLDAHVLHVIQQGRHRYYTLASPEMAHAIEALSAAARTADCERTTVAPTTPKELRAARTCYNHLAGQLGVALFDAMIAEGYWRFDGHEHLEISAGGWDWLKRELALDACDLQRSHSTALRPCLDWSERRYHGAGAVPSAMLSAMVDKGWLSLGPGRKASLTDSGQAALADALPSLPSNHA